MKRYLLIKKREVEKVTEEAMALIIETRQPRGWYYRKAGRRCYVGVDNSTGDAWTEEFRSLRICKRWLVDISLDAEGNKLWK